METRVITRINEVEILASRDNQYVPIRPICQALGIDPEGQRQKIHVRNPIYVCVRMDSIDRRISY